MSTDGVPELLRGARRRASIVESDGTTESTCAVYWLQPASVTSAVASQGKPND